MKDGSRIVVGEAALMWLAAQGMTGEEIQFLRGEIRGGADLEIEISSGCEGNPCGGRSASGGKHDPASQTAEHLSGK